MKRWDNNDGSYRPISRRWWAQQGNWGTPELANRQLDPNWRLMSTLKHGWRCGAAGILSWRGMISRTAAGRERRTTFPAGDEGYGNDMIFSWQWRSKSLRGEGDGRHLGTAGGGRWCLGGRASRRLAKDLGQELSLFIDGHVLRVGPGVLGVRDTKIERYITRIVMW
jgi:hypothetical protein